MEKTFYVKKSRLFSDVDYTAVLSSNNYLGFELQRRELKTIKITSGAICFFDPYATENTKPFLQVFPLGDATPFALTVSTSQGPRIGLSGLHFCNQKAVSWKKALYEDKDVLKLIGASDSLCTDIVSGISALGDYVDVRDYLTKLKSNTQSFHPLDGFVSLDGCTTARYETEKNNHAIGIFSSGWGEGQYRAYIGTAADGSITDLLCDFNMVEAPKRKEDSESVPFTFDMSIDELYIPDPKLTDSENHIAKWSFVISHANEVSGSMLFNAYSRRGFAYHSAEKYNEALKDYLKAVELGHELEKSGGFKFHAWSLYDNLGQIYREMGQTDNAVSVFKQAQKYGDTFYAGAYLNLIDLYLSVKDYFLAAKTADEMVRDRPQDPNAYNKRSEVSLLCEDYEKAISDLTILIDHFKLSEAILDKAYCLLNLGHTEKALAALDTYLIDSKANESYFFNRAQIFYKCKNFAETYLNLLKSYDCNPDFLPALQMLIEIDSLTFNNVNIIKLATRYIENRPDSEYGYSVRADAYFDLSRYDSHIEDCEYILSHIKKAEIYYTAVIKAALLKKDRGRVNKAIKILRMSDNAAYINALGLVLKDKRRYNKAERYLASSYKMSDNESYLLDLIDCLLLSGSYEKAGGALSMLHEKFPSSENYYLKTALLYKLRGLKEPFEAVKKEYVNNFLGGTQDSVFLSRIDNYFDLLKC